MGIVSRILSSKEGKNAIWIILGRAVQMILSFVVSVLTARYLGTSDFGLINYANAYVAFFTAFCTLGINSVIIKDFVDHPDEQGEAIGSAIGLRILSSILSCVMIVAIVGIVDEGDRTTITVAALCSLSLVFQAFDIIKSWFQSIYASKITTVITLIGYIIITVYKTVLLIGGMDVRWFAASHAIDTGVIAVMLHWSYRRHGGPRLSFSLSKGKRLVSKSYHYILSGMMVAIYGQTDKIMLKHMLDESAVGLYSLASSLCSMWVFILAAIIDSMVPTIIQLHKTDQGMFEKKNRQLYAIVIYLSAVMSIAFILFGEWGIVLLYGEEYQGAASVLRIITWYTAFSYLGVARNAWIVCENSQKYLKYIYFTAAVLNVLMNLLLIPRWGIEGAGLASLFTQIMTSIIVPAFIPAMRPNVLLMRDAFLLKKVR